MADNVNYTEPGTGTPIGVDKCTVNGVTNVGVALGKIGFGGNDVWTYVTSAVGLPVNVLNASFAVTGTFWQATQPVSGTITANAGTNLNTSLLALESGGNLAIVAGAVSGAKVQANVAQVGGTAVDTNSGNKSAGTLRLVIATDQPQLTNAWKVDGSAVVQPISDGGGSITVDGSISVSGVVPGTTATSLAKAEDQAAADGDVGVAVWAVRKDTAATTVGTDGDYAPFEVDGNGRLWVNGSSVTQPVSGTITANAGTNLNTSLLALEGGGNLATVAGAITSSKMQANVAQVGGTAVDTNSGNKSAGTLRFVIATDQPQLTNAWKVDGSAVTQPVSGTVTANTVQAGDVIQIGGTTYTVKRAFVDATTSGNTSVIALVGGKKLRVLSYAIGPVSAAVNVYFRSSTAGQITSTKCLAANGGMGRALNFFGHFETTAGEALQINLSANATVGVDVLYIEV